MRQDIFKVPKEARFPIILRGIFGFTSNIAGTIAMRLIPLAKATVCFYTNPIFIAFFGWLLLKEHITGFDIIGIVATFIGVVIFMNDPFDQSSADSVYITSHERLIDIIGTLVAIFGAM